jgi:putative flippase GtrA
MSCVAASLTTSPEVKFMREFVRYCLAGGTAFVADFTVFLLFAEFFGVNYLIANTLGFLVGLIVNYLISISWVFTYRKYLKTAPELSFFAIIGIGGIALGNSGMWLLVEHLSLGHVHAKIIVTAGILLYNYSSKKYFLFRAPANVQE